MLSRPFVNTGRVRQWLGAVQAAMIGPRVIASRYIDSHAGVHRDSWPSELSGAPRPEGERVARQLAMTDEDGQGALMTGLLGESGA